MIRFYVAASKTKMTEVVGRSAKLSRLPYINPTMFASCTVNHGRQPFTQPTKILQGAGRGPSSEERAAFTEHRAEHEMPMGYCVGQTKYFPIAAVPWNAQDTTHPWDNVLRHRSRQNNGALLKTKTVGLERSCRDVFIGASLGVFTLLVVEKRSGWNFLPRVCVVLRVTQSVVIGCRASASRNALPRASTGGCNRYICTGMSCVCVALVTVCFLVRGLPLHGRTLTHDEEDSVIETPEFPCCA